MKLRTFLLSTLITLILANSAVASCINTPTFLSEHRSLSILCATIDNETCYQLTLDLSLRELERNQRIVFFLTSIEANTLLTPADLDPREVVTFDAAFSTLHFPIVRIFPEDLQFEISLQLLPKESLGYRTSLIPFLLTAINEVPEKLDCTTEKLTRGCLLYKNGEIWLCEESTYTEKEALMLNAYCGGVAVDHCPDNYKASCYKRTEENEDPIRYFEYPHSDIPPDLFFWPVDEEGFCRFS